MQSASLVDWHREHGGLLAQVDGAWLPELYGNRDDEIDAARAGAGLADLSHLPVLTLTGAEVRRWTNGMFTNNTRKLRPGQGNRSAICEDRGRVQGLLDLYCLDDSTFLAVLEGASVAWFEERFQMFMVLDDIEMTDRTPETSLFTLLGPTSTGVLARAGLPTPLEPHDHLLADALPGGGGVPVRVTRKQRTGLVGFDLLVPAEAGLALWETLVAAGATAIGQSALDALRVLGGRARWPQDGTDKSLVHELALDKECCAFDKGCYVGQEVINRVDVKGAIQRRLTGLIIDGGASPPLGSKVLQGEAEVGALTSVTWLQNRSLGLGVLRRSAWDAGTALTIVAPDESRWQAVSADLPFVL